MIKSILINTFFIALAVLFQSTLAQHVAVYGVVPDIALIIILFVSLKKGSKVGELTGFLGGSLVDFLSLAPLGFHGLIYCIIGFFAGLTDKNISTESLLTQVLFIVASIFVKYVLATLLVVLFSIETTSFTLLSQSFFIELLYTTLLTPLIFGVANKVFFLTHRKRVGL